MFDLKKIFLFAALILVAGIAAASEGVDCDNDGIDDIFCQGNFCLANDGESGWCACVQGPTGGSTFESCASSTIAPANSAPSQSAWRILEPESELAHLFENPVGILATGVERQDSKPVDKPDPGI